MQRLLKIIPQFGLFGQLPGYCRRFCNRPFLRRHSSKSRSSQTGNKPTIPGLPGMVSESGKLAIDRNSRVKLSFDPGSVNNVEQRRPLTTRPYDTSKDGARIVLT
jgi:hypothetical protein